MQVFAAIGPLVAKASAGIQAGVAAAGGASTISTALSAASALSSIAGGFAARSEAKTAAAFATAEAAEETARGEAEARQLAREYEQLVAEQTVVQMANGLNVGIGTPQSIADATRRQAERNISVTRDNARNRARSARLRSRALLSEGRASLISGIGRAGTIAADTLQEVG